MIVSSWDGLFSVFMLPSGMIFFQGWVEISQLVSVGRRYMMTITAFPFRFFPCCIFLLGAVLIIVAESGVIADKRGSL